MPAVSRKQYRAMQAAAHGKSTLGIPKKVGKEFASATKSPKRLPARASGGKKPKKKYEKGRMSVRAGMTGY